MKNSKRRRSHGMAEKEFREVSELAKVGSQNLIHASDVYSSTPLERIFSTAGNTISALRARLTGKHIEVSVFLKHNEKISP